MPLELNSSYPSCPAVDSALQETRAIYECPQHRIWVDDAMREAAKNFDVAAALEKARANVGIKLQQAEI